MIQESRDLLVRILRNRRIFEIPLEECIKHSVKVRVNNKTGTLIVSCAVAGKTDSYNDDLQTWLSSKAPKASSGEATPDPLQ